MMRHGLVAVGLATVAVAGVAGCTHGSDEAKAPAPTVTVTSSAPTSAAASGGSTSPTAGAVSTNAAPAGQTDGQGSGPGLCTPTVATLRVTPLDGASEHFRITVQVTNAAKTSCVTTGYPGVALLDAGGRQIEQASRTRNGYMGGLSTSSTAIPRITLAPGQIATAVIEGQSYDVAAEKNCGSSPALLFTLPDNTDSTKLVTTTPVCAGLQVHPLVKGTTGNG